MIDIPYAHNIQLCMALIFSFWNFIPLFNTAFYKTPVDDYVGAEVSNSYLFQSYVAPIIISLIPGMDLILDILHLDPIALLQTKMLQVVNNDTSLRSDKNDSVYKETRLSISERILFLVGVLCLSIIAFPSYINAPSDISIYLYNAFANTNTILIICSILSFFSRCSSSFTPILSLSCGLFICIGCFLSSLAAIWTPGSVTFNNIVAASAIFIDIAAAIYVYACAVALFTYHVAVKDTSNNEDSLASRDIMSENKFRGNVVAAHMLATGVVIVLNAVWYWYVQGLSSFVVEICQYITVGSVAITYLIEFRVRRTEVSASLAALLDSKKSYVRYISHELRTPIAVALMGVNIAKLDLQKAYNIPNDAPVTQTLMDVEVACSSAVDILNDMLSFDKLESGALVLHKKNIKVVTFITECVKLFSIQCRQKNIELKIQYDVDKKLERRGASPIVAEDEFEGDQSKLEQIIRNLVANAITYSSAGSAVTLRVYYKQPKNGRRLSLSSRSNSSAVAKSGAAGSANSSFRHYIKGANSPNASEMLDEISVHSADGGQDFEGKEELDDQSALDDTRKKEGFGRLVIECVDQGAGISRKHQAKLFNGVMQFSAEKLQANGGTGYGLYISKGIAELHGGKLSVYSKGNGYGSTFTLQLPMLRSIVADTSDNKLTDKPSSIRIIDGDIGISECGDLSVKSLPTEFGGISTRTAMITKQSSSRTFEYSGVLDRDYNTNDMVDRKLETIMQMNEDSPRSAKEIVSGRSRKGDSIVGLAPEEVRESAINDNGSGAIELVVSDPATQLISSSVPVSRSSKTVSVQSNGSADSTLSEAAPPTYKLLAVDDSRVIRRLILKTMEAKGHTCDEAEDGVEGVNKIKAQLENGGVTYDAILMDFVMPNMDGPTATKTIRELGVTIPILGLTGNCLPRDVDWFIECGATAVMFKPLNVKEFDDHMKTHVGGK